MSTKARITVFIGLAVTVTGFVLITLAWNGAASQDIVQGQFPYLLSGGLAGLGMVMAGLAFAVIQLIKAEGDRRARQWEQLINAVDDLAARLAGESNGSTEDRTDQYWMQPYGIGGQASSAIPTATRPISGRFSER